VVEVEWSIKLAVGAEAKEFNSVFANGSVYRPNVSRNVDAVLIFYFAFQGMISKGGMIWTTFKKSQPVF
jgi:hypothetical protein